MPRTDYVRLLPDSDTVGIDLESGDELPYTAGGSGARSRLKEFASLVKNKVPVSSTSQRQFNRDNRILSGQRPSLTKKSVKFLDDTNVHSQLSKTNIPQRTTKTSQKLVLLPEDEEHEISSIRRSSLEAQGTRLSSEGELPFDEDFNFMRMSAFERAEELHSLNLPRVTAYCTSESFRLQKVKRFLQRNHQVKPRIYDECLYAAYKLPLVSREAEFKCRVCSSPLTGDKKDAGFDKMLDRSEMKNHQIELPPHNSNITLDGISAPEMNSAERTSDADKLSQVGTNSDHSSTTPQKSVLKKSSLIQQMYEWGEVFIFSYGVIVLWNFTDTQERDILADLTFCEGGTLMSRPLPTEDWEIEEFSFEYSPATHAPRIYNDIITLKSNDHFLKLAMSHALAQSVKLSHFEERMEKSMDSVQKIPRRIALTGELGMNRDQVMKLCGRLFKLRTDVNLGSNVLDTPDFFWESEPALNPLYTAFRGEFFKCIKFCLLIDSLEYLEIKPRIIVLNERCGVIFDLFNILSDSIAEYNEDRLSWFVIYLIVISVFVTTLEIIFRFYVISSKINRGKLMPSHV